MCIECTKLCTISHWMYKIVYNLRNCVRYKIAYIFWKMCIFNIKNCTYLCTFFEKLQMLNISNCVHFKNYICFFLRNKNYFCWMYKIAYIDFILWNITSFVEWYQMCTCLKIVYTGYTKLSLIFQKLYTLGYIIEYILKINKK